MTGKLSIEHKPTKRKKLRREARIAILRKLEEEAKRLSKELPPIPDEEIARIVREDRER